MVSAANVSKIVAIRSHDGQVGFDEPYLGALLALREIKRRTL